ncbi:PREDICTED: bone morphogenetic protein 4-like [Pygoscelis adeliae]|uniref:bone morphogenetic protein 4-like n=1 Tax=Pygoscelis adeliae TaxID=9238 RepID=UPI0004F4EA35|nr:PREDICTED: bone morphogenetic protein 4-like [Pygoscelis adeliae]
MAPPSAQASQEDAACRGMRPSGTGWGLHGPGCSHLQNVEQESERRGKQVSVYQVLEKSEPDAPGGKKLLAARLVSLQGSGWEVFAITQAVRDWTEDESSNQGLLVTVQGLGGSPLDPPPLQFATSRDHHESKKPMLVLFTDDGRRGASLPMAGFPAAGIIPPRGYNAYHCKGSCPFPLGENMRPTNHATVQSIINALKLSEGVSSPCCVPDKLYSINLLYFDDDENVVLKQYDDMVAGSCGWP